MRGRGVRRKNAAERKSGADGSAALESMRMSRGSERHQEEDWRGRELDGRKGEEGKDGEELRERETE